MDKELSKEKIELFDSIVISLSTAIKNCVLYPPTHPLVEFAIKVLKDTLDKWFVDEVRIDLGISQENLLLNGDFVKRDSKLYAEVADYLHQRGILAISILKDINTSEIIEFFKFIRNDTKTFVQMGGIIKNIPPTPHLIIKEIDFSAFLAGEKQGLTLSEKEIWQSLSRIADDLKGGQPPESKLEFVMDFLKDHKKSASILNKIYKDALSRLNEKSTAENIRGTFARITKYSEKYSTENAKEIKKNLTDIISSLDPNLVTGLFEEADIDGSVFDLSKEIFQDFSDDMVAEFITSMISKEGRINENFLKLFDKLASEQDRPSLALMVTDKLFEKRLLDKSTLSQLQLSIKEAFQAHPDSNFMSQIYKMTVDTFISKDAVSAVGLEKYSGLVKEYMEFLTEENLKKEKIRLLLNVIWLEKDPEQFKKSGDILIGIFPELLDLKYLESIREIFELFMENLRPEQKDNELITQEIKAVLNKINTRETIGRLVSCIPQVNGKDLEDIAYVLVKTEMNSAGILIDAFVSERDSTNRDKFGFVLSKMSWEISKDISRKLESASSKNLPAIKDLFKILKGLDSEEARLAAKRMIHNQDLQIRLEALEGFIPETEEERNIFFEIFKKEKDSEIQNKVLSALVKTKNKEMIDKLFRELEKGYLRKKYLLGLVQLCGDLKVQESLTHLGKLLDKRSFFNSKEINALRVASVVSLGQIGTPESKELIKKTLNDRSEPIRRMSRIVLELDKDKSTE